MSGVTFFGLFLIDLALLSVMVVLLSFKFEKACLLALHGLSIHDNHVTEGCQRKHTRR